MRLLILFILLAISCITFGNELGEGYDEAYKTYQRGSLLEAKEMALQLLPRAKQEDSTYYLVKLYFLLGYLATHTDDHGNAILYYVEGARIAEQSNDPGLQADLISIYKNLGLVLGNYQHYALAHKFINRGLNVALELGNADQVKSLLENRIHELLEEELYHEAIEQVDSILTTFDLDEAMLLRLKNKAGIAYKNTAQKKKAIANYEFIIKNGKEDEFIIKSRKDVIPEIYAKALHNLGNISFEDKEYTEALFYYKKVIELTKTIGINHLLFPSLESAGNTHFLLGNYGEAISYLQEAVLLDKQEDLEPDAYTVYEKLSKVYETLGDIESALHYRNMYTQRLEEFIAEQEKIRELNRKYNIQLLTEKHFDLLAVVQKQKETVNRIKLGLVTVTAIFLLLVLSFYIRKYRSKAPRSFI